MSKLNRYSNENIKKALDFIDYKDEEPLINIFLSIFDGSQSGETKILKINFSPLDSKLFGFLTHWFIQIENKEWHPGNKEDVLFVTACDSCNYQTSEILELCNYCAYNFLYEKMTADTNFNMFYQNCEIILNRYLETCLVYIICLFLLLFITTMCLIWLILFLIFYVLIIFVNYDTYKPKLRQCKHINNIINKSIFY